MKLCFICPLHREPRGFAFVQFIDPHDAAEAQYHMNRQLFGGREITVVLAAETRKRPEEMRGKARSGYVDMAFCINSCNFAARLDHSAELFLSGICQ